MKGTSKLNKKEASKSDFTSTRGIEGIDGSESSGGESTPEIRARTRVSLEGNSGKMQDEKEQLMEMMNDQQQELLALREALKYSQEEKKAASIAYMEISQKLTNSIPLTPGPNINKPRIPRPQDAAYQEIMIADEKNKEDDESKTEQDKMLTLFTNLANALKSSTKSDVSLPPKFYGDDDKWEGWYKQWRAYLQAKGWLTTADHQDGPRAKDFDVSINSNIYNTLMSLCQKGKAITYIEQAAEFDGHGANKQLLIRYDGFSKQKLQSLKKCVETMRHVSGTNMSTHIDKFEKICGQMVSCGYNPEQEEKIDWFLASVHEKTYEAMHAHCINLQLQGTLTFAQLIKLYTHQCFSRYPHFQVEDLTKGEKYTMNSTRFNGKNKRRQHETYNRDARGNYRKHDQGKGKGRPQHQGIRRQPPEDNRRRFTQNATQSKGKGRGQGKGKGKYGSEKGKGKSKGRGRGQSSYGNRKDTKEEIPMTNNSQTIYLEEPNTVGSDDETTIIFTQNMNRIMMDPGPEKPPVQAETNNGDENNPTQLSANDDPFTHIMQTMNSLPDSHEVWAYINPTRAYFSENWTNAYLEQDATINFIDWYDYQINMLAELKGDKKAKRENPQLTVMTQDYQDQLDDPNTWGSSSTVEPTWGKTKQDNLDETLKQWDETPTRIIDQPTRERTCQTCGDIMPEPHSVASPTCVTCQVLEQSTSSSRQPTRHAREERDDEVEFNRIPIAGEDSEDYMSDNDSDSINDDTPTVFTQNMTRIIMTTEPTGPHMEEDTTLPIVETLLPNTHMQALTGFATPPPTIEDPIASALTTLTGDDIAFLIGHTDGEVKTHELSPLLPHKNIYNDLTEVCDKINFTQNMQGMFKGDHKRKLTKEEKRMTRNIRYSDLADSAVPTSHNAERPQTLREQKISAKKYQRLNTSPITIPGTPDNLPSPPRKSRRFPVPDYSHRDTNYKQPPLCDRMLIDDYYAGRDLFPHEWAKDTGQKVPSQAKIITEDEFDFSDAGFASELFRIGGKEMQRDYHTRSSSDESDDSDSSKNSLRIYQQASTCYKPEQGESNAEATERHRLIAKRISEIKDDRKRKDGMTSNVRLSQHFHASYQLKRTIAIKQRRATVYKNTTLIDWGRSKKKINRDHTLPTLSSADNNSEPNKQWTITQEYTQYEKRYSTTLAKILHILQTISPDHELWDYDTPTAYVFVNSRAHGIALPPWPASKTEDDYFLGFQKWADKIRQTHKQLTQNIKVPPTYTNNTQTYEFEEEILNNKDTRITTHQIEVIMDTGATFTMLPRQFDFAWTDLKPCLHTIEGCFKGSGTNDETEIGEFHALITLDNGETRRLIIPQAIAVTPTIANTYLLATTPYLIAGHRYACNLQKPTLTFSKGGKYTMSVKQGHHIIRITPIDAYKPTPHKDILIHERHPYDPPTYHNNATTNRPNATTPTAFVYHLRYGCASEQVLKRTQAHVKGMEVQMHSWTKLKANLPCDGCLAGKMRKTNKAQSSAFTPSYNLALSWTPQTKDKVIIPNRDIATDWGIINKQLLPGKNNVFALFLDLNTGWIAVYSQPNRGLAGETLEQYCQEHGSPSTITHDNAAEYINGKFKTICTQKEITQRFSAPHTPNQNPAEHYMDIIMGKTRSLLFISGLIPKDYWEHALKHAACLQNRTALPGRTTPYQYNHGVQPDISHLRIFGCEALAYVEKEKRHKLDFKSERCIYLGISSRHSHDTHTLLRLSTNKVIYRRNVSFNERCFPARTHKLTTTIQDAKGSHLIGQTFTDEGDTFVVTNTSHRRGEDCLDYKNTKTNEEHVSTWQEVEQWIKDTTIQQLANNIQHARNGYVNKLAETMYRELQPKTYHVQLPSSNIKPPKSYNDAKGRESQWFEAFRKERDGMLKFNTWIPIPQHTVTPDMRKLALRAHHIYNVKRDGSAKVRVVVNGKRQHESTFSDTTSPVVSQLQFRTFLAFTALRHYHMVQMDLTNAYLHADIVDEVFIIIPPGFKGAGEVAKLDKATYGTKQGARRFYDHTVKVLTQIGFTQCPSEPCLFRYLMDEQAAFLILYVDDALISGPETLVTDIQNKLREYFDVKFTPPKDFIGLDLHHDPTNGTIKLSMQTFTKKLKDTFQIPDTPIVLTPGRTDKKIIRDQDPQPDPTYRSKVGSLMWTTMGIRYDITYTVKELSRVLQQPTKIAREILERTLTYVTQTPDAYLEFNPSAMQAFKLPTTRKKPQLSHDVYDTTSYNIKDTIPQHDDKLIPQLYKYKGHQFTITCYTDIDLAGQHETRQSTSGLLLYLNGALIHWHGRTERLIISSTAAGEYIALSRGHAAGNFMQTILLFYGNENRPFYLYTDNQAAEHIATQPTMNEHSRSIDIRHHAVRQDYLDRNVMVMGVRTDANPSDILTKFLPAPPHTRHASSLNITFAPTQSNITTDPIIPTHATTITYTQNGNFVNTPHKRTSTKRPGQHIVHEARQTQVRAMGQDSQLGQKLLSPITCTTNRQRKQRQRLWNAVHLLRHEHPHLEIKLKTTLTHSRRPEHRHPAKHDKPPHHHSTPRRRQHHNPSQPTPKHTDDLAILDPNRQHPKLQTRCQHNPLHQHPVRRRTPDHDLHTTQQINKRQKKRQAHQKSTKIFF